jgi:hypothetical protein
VISTEKRESYNLGDFGKNSNILHFEYCITAEEIVSFNSKELKIIRKGIDQ